MSTIRILGTDGGLENERGNNNTMDRVKEAIEYHLQTSDPQLSLYEDIVSDLWPLTTDRFTIRKDELTAKKILSKLALIEGMALHMARIWENLVTEDMILLLAQDTGTYCRNFGFSLDKSITRDEAEAILIGHSYESFKNFDYIIGYAKRRLAGKLNPFKRKLIPEDCQRGIDELILVRNHIAHRSKKSLRNYQKVLTRYGLRDKEPGPFLLFVPGQDNPDEIVMWVRGPGMKRVLGLYVDALKNASQSIVDYLNSVV